MNVFRKLTKDEIVAAQSSDSGGDDTITQPGSAVIVFDGCLKPRYTAMVEGVYYRDDSKAASWSLLDRVSYEIRMPNGRTRKIGATRVSTPEGMKMTYYKARLEKEMRIHDLAVSCAKANKAIRLEPNQ